MRAHDPVTLALAAVAAERRRRAADPALADRVKALKAWQQARFARHHADLLAAPDSAAAGRFFLDELYGPQDFEARDAQFARLAAPAQRLLPAPLAALLGDLAGLHALSERLDSAMAQAAPGPGPAWDARRYRQAWQALEGGTEAGQRARQLAQCIGLGRALSRQAGRPGLGWLLRSMRRPADAAGLGELQGFLERGLDAFQALAAPLDFLALLERREAALLAALAPGQGPAAELRAEAALDGPGAGRA